MPPHPLSTTIFFPHLHFFDLHCAAHWLTATVSTNFLTSISSHSGTTGGVLSYEKSLLALCSKTQTQVSFFSLNPLSCSTTLHCPSGSTAGDLLLWICLSPLLCLTDYPQFSILYLLKFPLKPISQEVSTNDYKSDLCPSPLFKTILVSRPHSSFLYMYHLIFCSPSSTCTSRRHTLLRTELILLSSSVHHYIPRYLRN